jgi:hypothetical protein
MKEHFYLRIIATPGQVPGLDLSITMMFLLGVYWIIVSAPEVTRETNFSMRS